MSNSLIRKILSFLFVFLAFTNFSFCSVALENAKSEKQEEEELNKEALNLMRDLFSGGAGMEDELQKFIAELQGEIQRKAKIELENRLKLLPEKHRELFLEQQRKFQEISLSICFENCLGKIINNVYCHLNDLVEGIEGSQASVIKFKAEKLSEILNAICFFLEKGYISILIGHCSLNSVEGKQKELTAFFYDYNQVPFFFPFYKNHDGHDEQQDEGSKKLDSFVTSKLKEFSGQLSFESLLKDSGQNHKNSKFIKLRYELAVLRKILIALSNKDLSSIVTICLDYLQIEAAQVYKNLSATEVLFKCLEKELGGHGESLEEKRKKAAVRFFLKELETFKKDLELFNSYKTDLKCQNSLWYRFFYNFMMVSYDLYGKVSEIKTGPFHFFDGNSWSTQFLSLYGWGDNVVRLAAAAGCFFDYYSALNGISLLGVMQGEGDLHTAAESKKILQFIAILKAAWLCKVTDSFSRNLWPPVKGVLQIIAALIYNHGFNFFTADRFWLNDDPNIRNAVCLFLREGKKSASELVEFLLWISNPTLAEKLEDKTLGIVKPELFGLALDILYPKLVGSMMPDAVARLSQNDLYNRLGVTYDFVEIRKPLTRENLNARGFSDAQINVLNGLVQDRDGNGIGLEELGKNGFDFWGSKEKNLKDNHGFTDNDIIRLKNHVNGVRYDYVEFIEGKIVGYIASSIGSHIGKSLVLKNQSALSSLAQKGMKGMALLLSKITGQDYVKELEEMDDQLKESFQLLKELIVGLIMSSGEKHIVYLLLYNFAGIGLLSYADAARYYKEINSNMDDMMKVSSCFDRMFKSVIKRIWGKVGGKVGAWIARGGAGMVMDAYGPFYPRIRNAFA